MSSHSQIPHAADELTPETGDRITRPFQRFASLSSSGGIVLLLCTVAALIWANSSYSSTYEKVFHETPFSIGLGSVAPEEHIADAGMDAAHATDPAAGESADTKTAGATHMVGASEDGAEEDSAVDHGPSINFSVFSKSNNLHWWINDFLMAIFFLLVGLEIKREVIVGELSDIKRASLPVIAALGGMIVPALIYTAFNYNNPETISGWGVPMATDIAFALGILALLGPRVPNSLKVFLASLAIADDLGALLVIAFFYTERLDMQALGMAGGIMVLLVIMNRMGFRRVLFYIIPGLFLWHFILLSNIHATIAGVLLATTIPVTSRVNADRYLRYSRAALDTFEENSSHEESAEINSRQRAAVEAISMNNRFVQPLLQRMEHSLHPWVAFLIIPVFALANAGVEIHGGILDSVRGQVSMGVILGLFLGKPIGVVGFSLLAVKLGIAKFPTGVTKRHILGTGFLAGIGFTMAIFIANLAYTGESAPMYLEHAKIGILVASFGASIVGLLILLTCPKNAAKHESSKEDSEH